MLIVIDNDSPYRKNFYAKHNLSYIADIKSKQYLCHFESVANRSSDIMAYDDMASEVPIKYVHTSVNAGYKEFSSMEKLLEYLEEHPWKQLSYNVIAQVWEIL